MSGLRARRLEKLGMVWSVADERFQENLEAAKAYYEDHWTLCAPRSATALDRPVGQWLSNLRRAGALDGHPEWKAALEAVDPYWNPDWPVDWQRHYAALRELVRDEGQADVLPGVTVHGMGVGRFVAKNRQHAVWQGLMDGQRELLEAIGIEKGNLTALPELAREYAEDNTGARIVIVDRTGRLLTDSAGTTATGTTLAGEPDIAAALRNQTTVATRTGTDGGDVLAATMPGSSGTTIRGGLRVTYPMTMVTDREHRIWAALALAGACVLAAVALVAFTLARWITRPLRTLERATTQLAAGRLDNPPDAGSGPPELRRLAAAFTHTATRLQHLLQAQHSFASEASHQLKTPLTSLRLRLENFEPYLDPRAHPSLEETIAEVERLSRMVHGLLALARLENTATTPEPVDADAVLAERAAMWEPLAAEQYVTITVFGPAVGRVWAIPGALEQIIDNLVANALRVSPPGTSITLARAPGADLHVIDQGPGMSEADRERAFDRFWRASDSHHDGTGLGLPIVRHLVHASGGEITLHAATGGGLDARVRLRPASRERRFQATAITGAAGRGR